MVYVSLQDVLIAFRRFAEMILSGKLERGENSLGSIANVLYPEPVTILELAGIVSEAAKKISNGVLVPSVRIVDTGLPPLFDEDDKNRVRFDVSKSKELLGLEEFTPPAEEIEAIIRRRLEATS